MKLAALILLAALLGCSSGRPNYKAQTSARKLSAEVRLTPGGVQIKNTDTMDFPAIEAKVNLNQTGGHDGAANVGPPPRGESITIPYAEFTAGTKRLKPQDTKILTVYVKAGDGSAKLFLCPGSKCSPS